MIFEISRQLESAIAAKRCPLPVIFGKEATTTTTFARERVVVEYDPDARDAFGPPIAARTSSKVRFVRSIPIKITIYAQAVTTGALPFEHIRRADRVVDVVAVALDDIVRSRGNFFTIVDGGYAIPDDLSASETIGGCVYQLRCRVDRGITDINFDGSSTGTFTIVKGSISNTTKVSQTTGLDDMQSPPVGAETV